MRAVCVVADGYPDRISDVLKGLYAAFWVERRQIWDSEGGFGPIFEEVLWAGGVGGGGGGDVVEAVCICVGPSSWQLGMSSGWMELIG